MLNQIIEDGESITFTSILSSGVDTNGDPITTTATYSGFGCPFAYMADEINGTSILSTDIKMLCTVDTEPKQGWKCTTRKGTFRIMRVIPISESGIDVLYSCQLRV
ncbi:MAG: hypothetical protein AB7F25_07030 [Deferribacterales bacterium]